MQRDLYLDDQSVVEKHHHHLYDDIDITGQDINYIINEKIK